jgi:hypothetical protein
VFVALLASGCNCGADTSGNDDVGISEQGPKPNTELGTAGDGKSGADYDPAQPKKDGGGGDGAGKADLGPQPPVNVYGTVEKHLLLPTGTTVYDIQRQHPKGIKVVTLGLATEASTTTKIDGAGNASYLIKTLPSAALIQLRALPDDPTTYLEGRSALFSPKHVITKPLVLFLLAKPLLTKLAGGAPDPKKGIVLVYVEDSKHKPVSGATVTLWTSTGQKAAVPFYPKADFSGGSSTDAIYPVAVFIDVPLPPAAAGTHYTLETTHPKMVFSDQLVVPAAGAVVMIAPD